MNYLSAGERAAGAIRAYSGRETQTGDGGHFHHTGVAVVDLVSLAVTAVSYPEASFA